MTDINKADIVDRMRSIDPTWDVWDAKGKTLLKECGLWCHEAADEIERLREALREISKLKISSEDGVNKYIVFMARSIARAAIGVKIDE